MSDDIQGAASLDLGNVIGNIQKLIKAQAEFAKGSENLAKMQVNLQQKTQSIYSEIGKLAGRISGGGPFKEIFEQVGKGEAIFARLTAGVVVAAVAFRAYELVTERNIIKAQAFVEAQNKVFEVNQKVRDSQDKIAAAGNAQNTTGYRALVATAGKPGLDAAQALEATGNFNRNEAINTAQSVFGRFRDPREQQNALAGIKEAVSYGLDSAEYTKRIVSLPALSKSAMDTTLGLALIQRNNSIGMSPQRALENARLHQWGDPFQEATTRDARIRSGIDANQRQQEVDVGQRQAGLDAAEAARPGLAEELAFYRQQEEHMRALVAAANQQNAWMGAIKDLLGGQSEQTKLSIYTQSQANAQLPGGALPPTNSPPAAQQSNRVNVPFYGGGY